MLPYVSPALRRAFIMGERDLRVAGDNRAKSNVYSLGVVMLHMSHLDMPMFITNLKDLQPNIEKRLTYLERYSKQWVKTLRRLLTVDERERPDFLQLMDEINRPIIPFMPASISSESFMDDEPLPLSTAKFTVPIDPLRVTLACGVPYLRVDSTNPDSEIPCVLRLEANPRVILKRPGLDVICVVDVSKGNEELKVIKAGLELVLLKLGETDRMAIIGYGRSGRKFAKLTICSKSGKVPLRDIISSIRPDIGSSLTAGLVSALHAVFQARTPNSLTSIFLFGSGAGEWQEEAVTTCVDVIKAVNSDNRLSLHCFAPGTEYNFRLIRAVTQEASGSLYLVQSEEAMRTAVDRTLTTLGSVVARVLKVTATNETESPYCTVGSYLGIKKSLPLQLPYIVAGQSFELVFMLSPVAKPINTPMKRSTIRFDIQYKGNSDEDISISQHLNVWLLPKTGVSIPTEDSRVFSSYYRRKAALYLFEVMDKVSDGKLQAARESLEECLKEVKEWNARGELEGIQKAMNKEKWNWEEWAKVISQAEGYYYGENEGKGSEMDIESMDEEKSPAPASITMPPEHFEGQTLKAEAEIPHEKPISPPTLRYQPASPLASSPLIHPVSMQESPRRAAEAAENSISPNVSAAPAQVPAKARSYRLKHKRPCSYPVLNPEPESSPKHKKLAK